MSSGERRKLRLGLMDWFQELRCLGLDCCQWQTAHSCALKSRLSRRRIWDECPISLFILEEIWSPQIVPRRLWMGWVIALIVLRCVVDVRGCERVRSRLRHASTELGSVFAARRPPQGSHRVLTRLMMKDFVGFVFTSPGTASTEDCVSILKIWQHSCRGGEQCLRC